MIIKEINSWKNLTSLGNETIKVGLTFENGEKSEVGVPTGISAGKYESKDISVGDSISQIRNIKKHLIDRDWNQETLDQKLNELGLGANTSLALSSCFWTAQNTINIRSYDLKFPKLMMLLFEGGRHGNPNITVQEFMVIEKSLEGAISDFKRLRNYLQTNNIETTVGVEGGFSPKFFNSVTCLETIKKVFPEKDIALDIAASFGENKILNYEHVISNYNIVSLEDPFADDDWDSWIDFYNHFGKKLMIVGDDLTATNPQRLKKAISLNAVNAVIIKPNQNGTITGTLEAVKLAKSKGLKVVVSHRGEETVDNWIVDFALKIGADFVKFGGISRGERISKYNRLLELGMK